MKIKLWFISILFGSGLGIEQVLLAESNFSIFRSNVCVPILFSTNDSPVVEIAVTALAGDISAITGTTPTIGNKELSSSSAIIAGTLGQSELIDQLAASEKISTVALDGKWETFAIQVIEKPLSGLDQALVIVGSDPRGTAFGVFELSKRLGVSPWIYWADVLPDQKEELSIYLDDVLMGPPSVKYRGIFLNDEDFGLRPWAMKNIDPTHNDIGPNTYAKVFELMLRLKSNIIWPAMHLGTRAFFGYEGNREMAYQYQIVIGSSHCEPMLRNNVDEWNLTYEDEYGNEPGPWRYDTNRENIRRYWEDRVIQTEEDDVQGAFTLGMRGIHDSGIRGGKSVQDKIKIMNQVFADQRAMLEEHKSEALTEIPQAFIPYAEVLSLYQAGAVPPEDVTIVWADDNHGYIRKLSNPEEQKRSGGSGVYYHLSYWFPGQDWLWLSSISPSLISYEMCKAFDYGADRMWIFNVGDLKPAEMEIQFAMDLAWDINAWRPERAPDYAFSWAKETFGPVVAQEIADIKAEYYRLAASGKPEHMNFVQRTKEEFEDRLTAYESLLSKTEALQPRIPKHLQDAYFQLILYPVKGAAKLNEKIISLVLNDPPSAVEAYDEIAAITEIYNTGIADGKWNGMMDDSPREQAVFLKPSLLPGLRIDLAVDLMSIQAPMTLKDNMLYGEAPERCDESTGGNAIYRFHSDIKATRMLTFYLKCPTPDEDSFFVRINGKLLVANNISTGEHWRWRNIGLFDLEKGDNTLEIIQREPNAKIKAIQFGTLPEQILPKQILVKKPNPSVTLPARSFTIADAKNLQLVQGLGVEGASLSPVKFTGKGWTQAENAPSAFTIVDLPAGRFEVKIHCVPTFPIHEGRSLKIGVRLGEGSFKIADMNTLYRSPTWFDNVFRGYSEQIVVVDQLHPGPVQLTVAILDPGTALSRVEIVPIK
ncbi:hypothetical protein G0Q06_03795 [Puniceicoccales bacterium CK1056]|uniref:Gylcosyl hydrolase 115 C-terminal domain-containing protein n=1 Tax=Oceanipulchritudo coccoides TaxID=2706888 RepID=A0A6B2M062_9BACT|nr:glycosyl hydrolase 115 family protein [Oceanipulchritudo coccoides]NDV61564.1 hypothetical protein [Oceanipulchritudo coccoides]